MRQRSQGSCSVRGYIQLVQSVESLLDPRGDHVLDAVGGLEPAHHVAHRVHSTALRVASSQQGAELLAVVLTGDAPGLRQQGCGAVSAYIVGIRLAGAVRVPEQAEQVVPQLERLAQRQPVGGVALLQPLTGPGQGAADQQGLLDGVLGGLVPDHLQ